MWRPQRGGLIVWEVSRSLVCSMWGGIGWRKVRLERWYRSDLQGLLIIIRDLDVNLRAVGSQKGLPILGAAWPDLHFWVITLAADWRRERPEARPESSDWFEDSVSHPKRSWGWPEQGVRSREEEKWGYLDLESLEWLALSGRVDWKFGAEGGVSDLGNWETGGMTQRWKGRQVGKTCKEAEKSLHYFRTSSK